MTKVFLFMWMCSSVPGNECIKIPTPKFQFNDLYDCTVYGYAHSEEIIVSKTIISTLLNFFATIYQLF